MNSNNRKNLVVGLTGGIGSGKSTISGYFHQKYHIPIVDADQLSRKVVEKGSEALSKMAAVFGEAILTPDGDLNRKKVRGMIASSPEVKQQIEAIQYPILQRSILNEIDQYKKQHESIIIYDCPIFFQTNQERYVDTVMVVICNREERIRRIVARDNTNQKMAESMINLQLSDNEMIKKADIIIDNSGNTEKLYAMLDKILNNFKKSLA